jgi:hypothetical protein
MAMHIVPCPHCHTAALLPEQLPLETTVCCPHCGQHFLLGEVLLCQFASWEIVDSPTAVADEIEIVQADATPQAKSKLAIDASIISSLATQSVIDSRRSSSSRQRRQPSGLLGLLPIIGGGLAAFPLALLILWYGLGRDVGGLGPQIAEFVPWIVPTKFRSAAWTDAKGAVYQASTKSTTSDRHRSLPVLDMPVTSSDRATTISTALEFDSVNQALDSNLSIAEGYEQVFASIHQAAERLNECSQALQDELPDRKELSLAAYSGLIEVAGQLSQQPDLAGLQRAVKRELEVVGQTIAKDSKLQSMLDQGSKYWIGKNARSDSFSLVAILEISDATRQDGSWKVVAAGDPLDQFAIEVSADLGLQLAADQRWLVFSQIRKSETSQQNPAQLSVTYLHKL